MFRMFNQFFSMFTTLFSAGDHAAKAIEHYSIYGEESAKASVDRLRVENAKALEALEAQ